MESFYEAGSRVWLLEGKDWVPATVTESKGGEVTFRTEYDKVSKRKWRKIDRIAQSKPPTIFANYKLK